VKSKELATAMKADNIYWEAFKTFFRIGIFTLGGGYAMIPLIEEEVVNKHRWVSKEEMIDLIAIAQSCPGVFAINISIFVGYRLQKVRPVDQFGHTVHVETVVLMSRVKD
jgi:chromate transport protein ChrA